MVRHNKKDTTSPYASQKELDNLDRLRALLRNSPLGDELLSNLPLYITRQSLMRVLFFKELYEKIINVHGVIMEFGCKWGKNLSLFTALRGIYEPYNHNRKIVGFDTFSGLRGISSRDGNSKYIDEGFISTTQGYEKHLDEVLACLEQECPIAHIKKNEIVKG